MNPSDSKASIDNVVEWRFMRCSLARWCERSVVFLQAERRPKTRSAHGLIILATLIRTGSSTSWPRGLVALRAPWIQLKAIEQPRIHLPPRRLVLAQLPQPGSEIGNGA